MATAQTMKHVLDIARVSMRQHRNVLMIGDHGVGKSQIVMREARRQGGIGHIASMWFHGCSDHSPALVTIQVYRSAP